MQFDLIVIGVLVGVALGFFAACRYLKAPVRMTAVHLMDACIDRLELLTDDYIDRRDARRCRSHRPAVTTTPETFDWTATVETDALPDDPSWLTGPSSTQSRPQFYDWATEDDI